MTKKSSSSYYSKSVNNTELKNILQELKKLGLRRFGTTSIKNIDKITLKKLGPYHDALKQVKQLDNEKKTNWVKKQNDFDVDYYEHGVKKKQVWV